MRAAFLPLLYFPDVAASAIGDYIVYALTTDETIALETGGGAGGSKVVLDDIVHIDSGTFSASAGTITVKETGTYLIVNHMSADDNDSGTNRTSTETKIHINGSLESGCFTDGFIRRNNNADECNDCAFGIYDLTANDTIEMFKQRINLAGSDGRLVGSTTTNTAGISALTVIRLNEARDALIMEATAASDIDPVTADVDIDVPWDVNTRIDAASFTHSTTVNPAEVTLINAGRYLVMYSDSYERDVDDAVRTGVYGRLQVDGASVPGSWSNNYMRGSQSGESILRGNLSCATVIETTSANQILKFTVAAEAGAINKTRLTGQARMCVYRLSGSESSFKIVSTSTQDIGSTATVTLTYDATTAPGWIDGAYSLASNQVTVPSGAFLCLHGVQADDGSTNRCEPWQRFRVDSTTDNVYGTGSEYARNTGGMEMVCATAGTVVNVGASADIDVRSNSRGASGVLPRVASTGGFCGLDLGSLA